MGELIGRTDDECIKCIILHDRVNFSLFLLFGHIVQRVNKHHRNIDSERRFERIFKNGHELLLNYSAFKLADRKYSLTLVKAYRSEILQPDIIYDIGKTCFQLLLN